MSCYFPIPYEYNLGNISNNVINSSITLPNYPTNFSLFFKKLIKKRIFFIVYIYLGILNGLSCLIINVNLEKNIVIKRKNLDILMIQWLLSFHQVI